MQLLLIRHGVAEEREVYARTGQEDDLRPLTAVGRKHTRQIANGLVTLVPKLDVLAASKLSRSVESAALIARRYGIKSTVELPSLAPGGRAGDLLNWLKKQPVDQTIALVGHEPELGKLTSWLLSGMRTNFMSYKKGGACLLRFDGEVESGAARLIWSIPPKQLRRVR